MASSNRPLGNRSCLWICRIYWNFVWPLPGASRSATRSDRRFALRVAAVRQVRDFRDETRPGPHSLRHTYAVKQSDRTYGVLFRVRSYTTTECRSALGRCDVAPRSTLATDDRYGVKFTRILVPSSSLLPGLFFPHELTFGPLALWRGRALHTAQWVHSHLLRGGTVIMMTSIGVPRTPQKDFWNTRCRRFVSAVS